MSFQIYSNMISRASRNFAGGMFIIGMLLIGFGFLIWALKELFAIVFTVLFCVGGVGCMMTAVKIYWMGRKIKKGSFDGSQGFRKNVQIHDEEYFDV